MQGRKESIDKKSENKRTVGKEYEDISTKYLQDNGLVIIERNFYTKFGEIDIIARDNKTIVFVEVKYRKQECNYQALEAVTPIKMKRITKSAYAYIMFKKLPMNGFYRFDCIGITGKEIIWIKNAFNATR
ncbi:MAG: YraN family protein [Lachnospiraceae bacterium]|nr:YraN family protein [Lachnospiraceae bacterium]